MNNSLILFLEIYSHLSLSTVIPCVEDDFRLVGGTNTSGRIEVCVDGLWGSICGDSVDDNTAAMICERIGLKGKVAPSCFELSIINIHFQH